MSAILFDQTAESLRRLAASVAIAFLTMGAAQSAVAQANTAAGVKAIDEVIVTARKREEAAFDIPATVQVFDRNVLFGLGADSFEELQTRIPNFFYQSERPFITNVTMRGLGAAQALPPGVGLYVDGAYQLAVGAFAIPLYDLERIEVLKGPQGTLYGRNSFAGVVNFITRPPSDEFSADIFAEIGDGNTQKGSLSISGPIVAGKLTGRLGASVQRRDGWRNYVASGNDADFDDYDTYNARLAYTPTDRFTADARFLYVDRTSGSFLLHQGTGVNDHHGQLLHTSPLTFGPFAGRDQYQGYVHESATLRLAYSLGNFELVSLSSWDDTDMFSVYDVDISTGDIFNVLTRIKSKAFNQEVRLQSTNDSSLTWLVGGYYTDGQRRYCCDGVQSGTLWSSFPGSTRTVPTTTRPIDGYAVFADLEYALNDRWVIGAGVRYDSIDQSTFNNNPADDTMLFGTWSDTQPKITLKYYVNDDMQIYFSSSKGFREGGHVPNLIDTQFETFPNDSLWSYEVGMKTGFANGRGQLEIAGFYIDADSYNGAAQIQLPDGRVPTVTVPIGAIESYGIELATSYQFTENFYADFNGGINTAEPTELSPNAVPGNAVVGEQVPNAPEWTFNLAGNLDVPLKTDMDLAFRADVGGVGPTYFTVLGAQGDTPLPERDSYYLVNFSAALNWDNYTITAYVKNATDETYTVVWYPAVAFSALGGGNTDAVQYNQPRYYGISFRMSF